MSVEAILNRVNAAYDAFTASYAGLSEAQMLEPGVVGSWSVRDLLAHITTWEQECLQALAVIRRGGRLPRYRDLYGGIHAFNKLMTERKAGLTLPEVREQAAQVHADLLAAVRSLSEAEAGANTRVYKRLRVDTWEHYPEHTQAIRAWREARGY